MGKRVNVTLEAEYAAKLDRLAERVHVPSGTLAKSLLATAIDEADPDPRSVTELLESVPGLSERILKSEGEVESGEFFELADLE
jgi:DNA-binding ferritin-like protein